MSYDIKTHGDFAKYFDSNYKRNYWALGCFGGGSINILEALEVAKQYAEANNVPLDTVLIDEILHSRRYKHFKIIYSQTEQQKDAEAMELKNVYEFLDLLN